MTDNSRDTNNSVFPLTIQEFKWSWLVPSGTGFCDVSSVVVGSCGSG